MINYLKQNLKSIIEVLIFLFFGLDFIVELWQITGGWLYLPKAIYVTFDFLLMFYLFYAYRDILIEKIKKYLSPEAAKIIMIILVATQSAGDLSGINKKLPILFDYVFMAFDFLICMLVYKPALSFLRGLLKK